MDELPIKSEEKGEKDDEKMEIISEEGHDDGWKDVSGDEEDEMESVDLQNQSTNQLNNEGGDKKKKRTKKPKTYLPGMPIKEGEELVCEESAYVCLHTFTTSAPCLSFDIINDNLGSNRTLFPLSAYAISGTQAQRSHANNLMIMKMSNVYKTQPKGSDDELSSDEDDDEGVTDEELMKKPELNVALLPHHGVINRVRFNYVGERPLAASWSELGKVCLWDLTVQLKALDDLHLFQEYIKLKNKPRPIFEFKGHRSEGFALDWSPTTPGMLASGDSVKFIHIWHPTESSWTVESRPFQGHSGSVEDIQWSPNEKHVLASCSSDKSIRIWDARERGGKGCLITKSDAHDKDVNVISWSRRDNFIASGGDDNTLKIWDLRQFQRDAVAEFRHHHKGPITSVEWSPHESTVLSTAGEDDQIAIWDLSVEKDTEENNTTNPDDLDVPPQLMFVHQGQQDIKEIHWHSQIPGLLISTAANGFNVFKPYNI